jgi:cysteine synthase
MLCAAVDVAQELGLGKRVVTVVPDSAERYLSKDLLG